MALSNRVKIYRTIFPGFFTVANMFCGFYSILSVIEGNLELAAWMIFFAAFLDVMDGKIARITDSSSKFGVEYDSLADVISFGFAPSVLIHALYFKSLGIVGILISFLPLLFGSIRLARFNISIDTADKTFFTGLPIPMAALALASFVIFSTHFFSQQFPVFRLVILLVLIVSVLMVSNVSYDTFPLLTFKGSYRNKIKLIVFVILGFVLIIFPRLTLFPFIILYIISGIVRLLFTKSLAGEKTGESKD